LIFGSLRKYLRDVFHDLAQQKVVVIEEGHLMPDHVHICLSIPPMLAVSNVVGFIKDNGPISIALQYMGRQRSFNGEAFWARVYYVSTVGLDVDMTKEYIRDEEKMRLIAIN
jgi:putative transposase